MVEGARFRVWWRWESVACDRGRRRGACGGGSTVTVESVSGHGIFLGVTEREWCSCIVRDTLVHLYRPVRLQTMLWMY